MLPGKDEGSRQTGRAARQLHFGATSIELAASDCSGTSVLAAGLNGAPERGVSQARVGRGGARTSNCGRISSPVVAGADEEPCWTTNMPGAAWSTLTSPLAACATSGSLPRSGG